MCCAGSTFQWVSSHANISVIPFESLSFLCSATDSNGTSDEDSWSLSDVLNDVPEAARSVRFNWLFCGRQLDARQISSPRLARLANAFFCAQFHLPIQSMLSKVLAPGSEEEVREQGFPKKHEEGRKPHPSAHAGRAAINAHEVRRGSQTYASRGYVEMRLAVDGTVGDHSANPNTNAKVCFI